MKYEKLGKRGLVRIISFTLALILVLTTTAVAAYTTAYRYRTTIEYSYQRALNELAEYISNMDVTLQKGQYANTATQMQGLSSKLAQEAGYAKGSLAQLPLTNEDLSATYKFLSQVGNFCVSLSDRVSEGNTVTDEDLTSLDQLSGYASDLSQRLQQMVSDLESGTLQIGEVKDILSVTETQQEAPTIDSGFREIEDSFTDYPTLIYDGPFSDNIQQQSPKYLADKPEVTAEQALQVALAATGAASLNRTDDSDGTLPCYNFTSDTLTVSVTKAGGVVNYFINSRSVGEPAISQEDAITIAQKKLESMGLTGFVYRYYNTNSGILTINFAGTQNGVVCYPDLIKVGIALDDGSVATYDAKGYISNHTSRDIATPSVTMDKARSVLSKRLTPESSATVLIPAEDLSEVLCYEFLCTGENEEHVLVYINAKTGMEEQILILMEDDTGVLAM